MCVLLFVLKKINAAREGQKENGVLTLLLGRVEAGDGRERMLEPVGKRTGG